jgi:hypothetical protein
MVPLGPSEDISHFPATLAGSSAASALLASISSSPHANANAKE